MTHVNPGAMVAAQMVGCGRTAAGGAGVVRCVRGVDVGEADEPRPSACSDPQPTRLLPSSTAQVTPTTRESRAPRCASMRTTLCRGAPPHMAGGHLVPARRRL